MKRFCMRILAPLLVMVGYMPMSAASSIGQVMLPLSIVDNRPFVDVRIDNRGPFSFLLDTGSSSTTVSAALSESLHLFEKHSGTASGAGEKQVEYQSVRVSKVAVGPFSIGPLDAPAFDTSELSRVIGFHHFDGVLGVELFYQYVVTIDAAQQQLSLITPSQFKPDVGAVAVPFTLDDNEMPIVTASIAGVTSSFQVDTGDRSSLTLFGPFWRAHDMDHAIAPTVTAMTGYGIGGPILSIVGRPKNLSIGGLVVSHPVVRLSLQKSGRFTIKNRAGSIGMGVLKRFKVSFDYSHKVMWLSKGPDFDLPDPYDRIGLWLGLGSENALEVMAVTSGSPAAQAGMETGDLLTKIGDLPAGSGTLFEIRNVLQNTSSKPLVMHGIRNNSPFTKWLNARDMIAPP